MNAICSMFVIARSVLLEAIRRKDVYVLVAICLVLIGVTASIDFFDVGFTTKFYREIALQLMGTFTAIAVVLLAVRQLPREFALRTIYPLLARPVSRTTFILGKAMGIGLAALFCYALFMLIFIPGIYLLGGDIAWPLFWQHMYLQFLQMILLTFACFLLSLSFSQDAALTIALLLYFAADIISQVSVTLYELSDHVGRLLLQAMNYALPQLALFDLSGKVLHSEMWDPLSLRILMALTLYAVIYIGVFATGSYALFRRKPL